MKQHDQQDFEKLEKLASELEKHPLTKELRDKEAAALLEKRLETAQQIEAARAKLDTVTSEMQAAIDEKEVFFRNAKAVLNEAQEDLHNAKAALFTERINREAEIKAQENFLLNTCDSRIDETINFFMGKLDYFRSPGRISTIAAGSESNLITDTLIEKKESNSPAILRAIHYCMSAIQVLRGMKLDPVCDLEKIEMLKNGIPHHDEFSEYQIEKPLWPKGVNPLMECPSESTLQFSMDRLLEKAKKFLRR